MTWKKGAVVIKKHGDEEWADAMEKTLNVQRAAKKEMEELIKENEELKRDNTFMKKHIVEDLENKMADAERDYSYNWTPQSKFAKYVTEGFAFVIYHIVMFIDKYLVLR